MKKILLALVAVIAAMPFGLSAASPADYFTWSYGSQAPYTPCGEGNTMLSFSYVVGEIGEDVAMAIPGSYSNEEHQIYDTQSGQYLKKNMNLLNLSSKKVMIAGPNTNESKYISAVYPSSEWPEEFSNGMQPCKRIRFGLWPTAKTPGTYTVLFPAGSLYFNGQPCEEFTVQFIVEDNRYYQPVSFTFDVDPIPGATIEVLRSPTLTMNNYDDENKEMYRFLGMAPNAYATLTKQGGESVQYPVRSDAMAATSKLKWIVDFNYENSGFVITDPGTYTLEIPSGIIRLEDLSTGTLCTNTNKTYKFIVDNNKEITYIPTDFNFTVTPAPNTQLNRLTSPIITLSNPGEKYISSSTPANSEATITRKGGSAVKYPFVVSGTTNGDLAWEVSIENAITEDGTYTLDIPADMMRLRESGTDNYYTNKALKYTFIVGEPTAPGTENMYDGTPVVYPQAGDVTAFQSIEIEKPSDYNIYLPDQIIAFTLTAPDGSKSTVYPRAGMLGSYIYVDIPTPCNTKGQYTLTIPEGGIQYFKSVEGNVYDNTPYLVKEQDIVYNVTMGEETDLAVKLTPANGSVIYKLIEMPLITFEEEITPTIGLFTSLKMPDGTTRNYKLTYSTQNKRFMISMGDFPNQKGVYEFTIPAGLVKTASGKINKEFKYTFNFVERKFEDLAFTTDPENGSKVNVLENIKLINPENVTNVVRIDGGTTYANFFTPGDEESSYRTIKEGEGGYYIDLREKYVGGPETNGLYTIQIPEGYLICTLTDGTEVLNNLLSFSWILTDEPLDGAVEEIADNDGLFTVYDIQGRLIFNKVELDRLSGLTKGIYIINGVKTILK